MSEPKRTLMPPTHAKKPAAMREKCAHGGPLHCSEGCYSKGGDIKKEHRQHDELQAKRGESYGHETSGVHSPSYSHGNDRGASIAGSLVRGATSGQGGKRYYQGDQKIALAKEEHKERLGELRADKTDRRNLAEGGEVTFHSPAGGSANRAKGANRVRREEGQKGVHTSNSVYSPGESRAGGYTRDVKHGGMEPSANRQYREASREMHRDKLSELKSMKGPHGNYAEGGDVESLDDPMEHEDHDDMSDIIVDELMDAMERKDKRGVKDAIEAMVMECMNKGGM